MSKFLLGVTFFLCCEKASQKLRIGLLLSLDKPFQILSIGIYYAMTNLLKSLLLEVLMLGETSEKSVSEFIRSGQHMHEVSSAIHALPDMGMRKTPCKSCVNTYQDTAKSRWMIDKQIKPQIRAVSLFSGWLGVSVYWVNWALYDWFASTRPGCSPTLLWYDCNILYNQPCTRPITRIVFGRPTRRFWTV